jgi:hypothetical protein
MQAGRPIFIPRARACRHALIGGGRVESIAAIIAAADRDIAAADIGEKAAVSICESRLPVKMLP